jgi:hypothetical protein
MMNVDKVFHMKTSDYMVLRKQMSLKYYSYVSYSNMGKLQAFP